MGVDLHSLLRYFGGLQARCPSLLKVVIPRKPSGRREGPDFDSSEGCHRSSRPANRRPERGTRGYFFYRYASGQSCCIPARDNPPLQQVARWNRVARQPRGRRKNHQFPANSSTPDLDALFRSSGLSRAGVNPSRRPCATAWAFCSVAPWPRQSLFPYLVWTGWLAVHALNNSGQRQSATLEG